MANTNSNTLPGIIGQVYEDRRNGEFGTLVSRDTKCKTMEYQREDGTTFVRSYSHFRSYMRKKAEASAEVIKEEAYAEAELTSVEVSEEDAKKMEKNAKRKAKAEEKAKKEVESTEPAKRGRSAYLTGLIADRDSAFEESVTAFAKAVESFPDGAIRLTASLNKKMISICLYGKKHIEFFVHARGGISKFIIHKEAFISYITDIAQSVYEVKPESGRHMNVGNFIVAIKNSDISTVADIIHTYFVDRINEANQVNEKKKESED